MIVSSTQKIVGHAIVPGHADAIIGSADFDFSSVAEVLSL